MRCLISFALCLLALALGPIFTSAEFMCPEVGHAEEKSCINQCNTDAECSLDTMCCPSICGASCKIPIRIDGPKVGHCPWNAHHMSHIRPCPEEDECSRDSDCEGIRKCCNEDCAMKCVIPQAESSLH